MVEDLRRRSRGEVWTYVQRRSLDEAVVAGEKEISLAKSNEEEISGRSGSGCASGRSGGGG